MCDAGGLVWMFVVVGGLFLARSAVLVEGSRDAEALYTYLMKDYSKLIRPVETNEEVLGVMLELKLMQLISVVGRLSRCENSLAVNTVLSLPVDSSLFTVKHFSLALQDEVNQVITVNVEVKQVSLAIKQARTTSKSISKFNQQREETFPTAFCHGMAPLSVIVFITHQFFQIKTWKHYKSDLRNLSRELCMFLYWGVQ